MQKHPKASAIGWSCVFGLVVMLSMSACESVTVKPVPTELKPDVHVTLSETDPPERPTRPPGP